jgi:hypothetical protein
MKEARHILMYYPEICLEGLRKTTGIAHVSRFTRRDFKSKSPKLETGMPNIMCGDVSKIQIA